MHLIGFSCHLCPIITLVSTKSIKPTKWDENKQRIGESGYNTVLAYVIKNQYMIQNYTCLYQFTTIHLPLTWINLMTSMPKIKILENLRLHVIFSILSKQSIFYITSIDGISNCMLAFPLIAEYGYKLIYIIDELLNHQKLEHCHIHSIFDSQFF